MNLFGVYFRAISRQWPLFILLAACQLVLGEISSVALNEKKPEMTMALCLESDSLWARRYARALEEIPELRIIKVPLPVQREKIFAAHSVQGLAIITPQFDQRLTSGSGGAVLLYPAPGIGDISVIEEFLAMEAAMLRVDILWREQLGALGLTPEDAPLPETARPILTVAYDGPPALSPPLSVPPAFGVPALFLLPIFLQASQMAPGPDNRRLLLRGRQTLARVGAAFGAAVWAVCVLLISLYLLGLNLFYRLSVTPLLAGVFLLLAFYAAALGCLLAAAGRRHWSAWVFIPWFLLNMTFGGGLWNLPLRSPLLLPLLPLGAITAAQNGHWTWLWLLAAQTVVAAIAALTLLRGSAPSRKPDCAV